MKDPFGCSEPAQLIPAGVVGEGAAYRAVAARATDPADLEMLLDMLGLVPPGPTPDADTP
ncbi:hypothetical protein [Streptomyces sp. NRRL F-2664]|uniref:hypothetical protein n=1 Tax=Streptomyces sp. NRRL F-2664 TaxID=1463842 RepID=UPI0004CC8A6C|nr:hypothetical protein [Streptomyces sp. NRRL F-2664]